MRNVIFFSMIRQGHLPSVSYLMVSEVFLSLICILLVFFCSYGSRLKSYYLNSSPLFFVRVCHIHTAKVYTPFADNKKRQFSFRFNDRGNRNYSRINKSTWRGGGQTGRVASLAALGVRSTEYGVRSTEQEYGVRSTEYGGEEKLLLHINLKLMQIYMREEEYLQNEPV